MVNALVSWAAFVDTKIEIEPILILASQTAGVEIAEIKIDVETVQIGGWVIAGVCVIESEIEVETHAALGAIARRGCSRFAGCDRPTRGARAGQACSKSVRSGNGRAVGDLRQCRCLPIETFDVSLLDIDLEQFEADVGAVRICIKCCAKGCSGFGEVPVGHVHICLGKNILAIFRIAVATRGREIRFRQGRHHLRFIDRTLDRFFRRPRDFWDLASG